MPRVTYVKKAQQRYETKPVIDPATGEQKRTPVMRAGKQRTTKTGRPVFMDVTEPDLTKPKPNRKCESCGTEIKVGDPYKHVAVKRSYGSIKRVRCSTCPSWQPWELSDAWWARIAQATSDFDVSDAESADDVQSALEEVAGAIRELAEESREVASNVEEGFGHPTSVSEEAENRADELDSWADEIESVDIPDLGGDDYACTACSGTGEEECGECGGTGELDADHDYEPGETAGPMATDPDCKVCGEPKDDAAHEAQSCDTCSGTGQDDCSGECGGDEDWRDMDEWRSAVEEACSIVNESPV